MKTRTLVHRLLVLAALAGLGLLVIGAAATNEDYIVSLSTSGGVWHVTGYIEFTARTKGTISTDNGNISVPAGSRVKIVVDATDRGFIWLHQGVEVYFIDVPVASISINGSEVAENTVITRMVMVPSGSIESTLRLEVMISTPTQTQLRVNDETLINGDYTGYIMVYNLNADQDTRLSLHINTHSIPFGAAKGVEYNGNVIGISEYPFLKQLLSLGKSI